MRRLRIQRRGPGAFGPWAVALLLALTTAPRAHGQGAQVEIQEPPGAPDVRGKLGPALGSSGTSSFDVLGVTQMESLFGGRAGPSAPRVPLNQLSQPRPPVVPIRPISAPRPLETAAVPTYGELEEPGKPEDLGPPSGLTLDGAIERLVQKNLNLIALRFEVPMAQADILTASLRANPIFYWDVQFIPYGHFSSVSRPGGPTQPDVNVTYPIDVWRKRKARILSAEAARRVTEAQLQDAVRLQIDNLYTAYVDVVAARETLRFSQAYLQGLERLMKLNVELFRRGQITQATVDQIHSQMEQAQLQVHEAEQAIRKTNRTLGLLLDMPRKESDALQVRAALRDTRPLPVPEEELTQMAVAARPDLVAYRLGVHRAQADLRLAHANRYSDVYLLYQPYTFQNNQYLGLRSATSWAIGMTVALPVYNRNQGNIARAKHNVTQSEVETTAQERQVVYEVEEGVREFELSLRSVNELEREVVPAARRVRDAAFRRWQGGETSALEYLEAQKDYNEVVRNYRDALVRHRRAMLDLNTDVGMRILP